MTVSNSDSFHQRLPRENSLWKGLICDARTGESVSFLKSFQKRTTPPTLADQLIKFLDIASVKRRFEFQQKDVTLAMSYYVHFFRSLASLDVNLGMFSLNAGESV